MKWLVKAKGKFLKRQKGISLIETLVALGILAVIGVAMLNALSVISKNTGIYEEHVTATCLAQSQMEKIRATAYRTDGQYPVTVTAPSGYAISISTVQMATDEQEITVTVAWGGATTFKLKTIKTNA